MPPPESPPASPSLLASLFPRFAAGALALCLVACVSRTPAPVEERAPRAKPPVASSVPAPAPRPAVEPDWRPQSYTVKQGDTLYAIALDHGLDYRELAAWNNVENVNRIRVGQVLRLTAPGAGAPAGAGAAEVVTAPLRTAPPVVAGEARPALPSSETRTFGPAPSGPSPAAQAARNSDDYKTQPKALKEPYSDQALRDVQRAANAAPAPTAAAPTPTDAPPPPPAAAVAAAPAAGPAAEPRAATRAEDDDEKVDWSWPARGRIVTGFSEVASMKGIDIAGTAGQGVAASAGGKVVYAGAGLRGYGKLIIIKHNGTFLSAYAHNRDIVVKEGQQVAKGQKIAEMGNTDADQVKLHFEIRRHGKPVDPLRYLPPA